ncbi:type IV secretion protein Rhs, partial [Psychrobacter sp. NPDC078370]
MSEPTLKRLFNRYVRSDTSTQQSRYLTDGEIALAYSVFGDSIKLDEVQLKTAWWVLKHYAVSPNGNIYFNSVDWITDFSEAPLSKQSWLI